MPDHRGEPVQMSQGTDSDGVAPAKLRRPKAAKPSVTTSKAPKVAQAHKAAPAPKTRRRRSPRNAAMALGAGAAAPADTGPSILETQAVAGPATMDPPLPPERDLAEDASVAGDLLPPDARPDETFDHPLPLPIAAPVADAPDMDRADRPVDTAALASAPTRGRLSIFRVSVAASIALAGLLAAARYTDVHLASDGSTGSISPRYGHGAATGLPPMLIAVPMPAPSDTLLLPAAGMGAAVETGSVAQILAPSASESVLAREGRPVAAARGPAVDRQAARKTASAVGAAPPLRTEGSDAAGAGRTHVAGPANQRRGKAGPRAEPGSESAGNPVWNFVTNMLR